MRVSHSQIILDSLAGQAVFLDGLPGKEDYALARVQEAKSQLQAYKEKVLAGGRKHKRNRQAVAEHLDRVIRRIQPSQYYDDHGSILAQAQKKSQPYDSSYLVDHPELMPPRLHWQIDKETDNFDAPLRVKLMLGDRQFNTVSHPDDLERTKQSLLKNVTKEIIRKNPVHGPAIAHAAHVPDGHPLLIAQDKVGNAHYEFAVHPTLDDRGELVFHPVARPVTEKGFSRWKRVHNCNACPDYHSAVGQLARPGLLSSQAKVFDPSLRKGG